MVDAHFGVIGGKLKEFLKEFFRVLEGSLHPFIEFLRCEKVNFSTFFEATFQKHREFQCCTDPYWKKC